MPSSPSGSVHPVLIDADALIGLCKTQFEDVVFENFAMSTTNVCNEEVKKGRNAGKSRVHREACQRYLKLLGENRNPHVASVERWKPHVSDQGEKTIKAALREWGDEVDFVVVFDGEAIEDFKQLRHQESLQFKIRYPNFPLEYLRRKGILSPEEYCEGTYRMAEEEGWTNESLLNKLASTSPVDCDQF